MKKAMPVVSLESTPKLLAHYTQIPVLLDVLKRKKLVLSNPENWEDKSDVALLKHYAHKDNIRVLCFKELKGHQDSILHWKAYADGMSGCRIDFDFEKLSQAAKAIKAKLGKVEYFGPSIQNAIELPFVKRASYAGEQEWRIVWKGKLKTEQELSIKKGAIDRITFSAKMPRSLFDRIKVFLKDELKVNFNISQSQIFENERWEKTVLASKMGVKD